jgi:hypothetical protein
MLLGTHLGYVASGTVAHLIVVVLSQQSLLTRQLALARRQVVEHTVRDEKAERAGSSKQRGVSGQQSSALTQARSSPLF